MVGKCRKFKTKVRGTILSGHDRCWSNTSLQRVKTERCKHRYEYEKGGKRHCYQGKGPHARIRKKLKLDEYGQKIEY